MPSGAADYCVNLYLDGEYVDGRVDPADLGKRSGGSFKDVWLNERFIGLLAFREPTFGFAIEGDGQYFTCEFTRMLANHSTKCVNYRYPRV